MSDEIRQVSVNGDCSPRSWLRITESSSSDIAVETITEDSDGFRHHSAVIEFCMSGCRSRKTREALRKVIDAIEEDEKEKF